MAGPNAPVLGSPVETRGEGLTTVSEFVTLVEVPAAVFLGVWFLLELSSGGVGLLSPSARGGVAFFAHVGGFLFGLLVARLLLPPGHRPLAAASASS